MTSFEIMYAIFGSFVTSAGIVMVITYSLTNPWWKTHLGRMMITYAIAEIIMSGLLMFTVLTHISPEWFRGVWFALQTIVGMTFWFQTSVIIRLHREKRRKERS